MSPTARQRLLEPAMSQPATRVEHDLLGDKAVPADAYYGVQTARALENFHISGVELRLYPDVIRGLAMVKMAAARANDDRATELADEAMRTGRGILELVRERNVLTDQQVAEVLDPITMTGQARPV
jgi:aspartate ammonia-lyase